MLQTKLLPFTVSFANREEFHHLKREIWGGHCYYVELESEAPTIIDVGAHIGMASLYFAKNYPTAKIISLEPNPLTYKILEENIWQNRLEDRVTCLHQAVSDHAGKQSLHLNPKPNDWQLNSSLNPTTWTNQPLPNSVAVETITLSSLLDQPVDLLKLDVEGMEQQLISEAMGKLRLVRQIFIEFHPRPSNNLTDILTLLEKQNFEVTLWKNGQQTTQSQTKGLTLISAHQ